MYVWYMRKLVRKIRQAIFRVYWRTEASVDGILESTLPRKASKVRIVRTVPQTDTGDQVEKTKANE